MIQAIKEHSSVRNFVAGREIPDKLMRQLIEAASRASTTGGMQLYSIIVSQSEEMKGKLAPLHFNQPMIKGCSALVTFCVDVARFSRWCRLRGAEPGYNNFAWWVNGAIDTLLAAENFSLEAESEGLGICYLGTTIYTTRAMIEALKLSKGVVPITTVALGYPETKPEIQMRLPLEAVWHKECYEEPSDGDIEQYYSETEASEQTKQLLLDNDLPNLARVFTDRRYKREDNEAISISYYEALREQGFID